MKKETLSLPDIVDILGPRPFPLKETLTEYLKELREREEIEQEMKDNELKAQAERREADSAAIKFDPDAEETEPIEEKEGKSETKEDEKVATDSQKEESKSEDDKEKKQ